MGALVLGVVGGLAVAMPAAAAPGSPGGLGASQPDSTTTVLTWNRVGDAARYDVQVDNDGDFSSPEITRTTTNTTLVPDKALRGGQHAWRVRAVAPNGDASAWTVSGFTQSPISTPVPLAPANGAPLQQPADPPLLQWSSVPGATSYTVEVDNDDDFVGAKSYTTKTTSLVVPDPLGADTWHWRVTASRGAGLLSSPSDDWRFDILAIPAPDLVFPDDDEVVQVEDVVLDWEPVEGARSYEVQVAKASFTNIVEYRRDIRGTRYSPPNGYDNDQYLWRVRAIDLAGTPTPWSESQNVFNRQWPDRPWPIFPRQDGFPTTPDSANYDPDDSRYELRTISTDAPYFQWTPVQHASHYRLQIDTEPGFQSPTTTCRVAGTTYTPGNGLYDGSGSSTGDEACTIKEDQQYYWRVQPMDRPYSAAGRPDGIIGIWSPAQRFRWKPQYFAQVTPGNGAVVDIPTFRWTERLSTAQYRVDIWDAQGMQVDGRTTHSNSYTPVGRRLDPARGPFTWKLSAVAANGTSSLLYEREFELAEEPALPTGTPLEALSGTSDDPATTRAPDLRWVPMPGAHEYQVRLGTAGTSAWWTQGQGESFGSRTRYPSFTETGSRVLGVGQYDWQVIAYNEAGNQIGQSAINTFRIAGLPEVTGQRIAIDGDTLDEGAGCDGRLLIDQGRTVPDPDSVQCNVLPATPMFSWDPVPGASHYLLYVSEDENFTNLVEPTRTIGTWNTRYAFTFANAKPALPENVSAVPYYWHVRPCKSLTICGPDPRSSATSLARNAFRKESPKVQLTAPAQNAQVESSDVTFTWADYFDTNQARAWTSRRTFNDNDATNDVSGSENSPQSGLQYRLQVDDESTFSAPLVDDVYVDQATYTAFSKLYPEGTLHWRVAAIDGAGNQLVWSDPVSFRKRTPTVTLSPMGTTANGSTPFRWKSQAYTSSYRLEVYKNNDTTFSPANRVVLENVRTAAYATNVPLPVSSQDYVWRVRRTDASNNDGDWSTPGRYRVQAGSLPLLAPADGAVQPPNGPVLSWGALEGAATYRVEVTTAGGQRVVAPATTVATSFAVTDSLKSESYRWTVTAVDSNGGDLASASRTFVVDAALAAVTPPVVVPVAGAQVGSELQLTPPSWNRDGVTNSYQWLRDGQPIGGATGVTYLIASADYAKSISVKVTGSLPAYASTSVTSEAVVGQAGPGLVASAPPQISGDEKVGGRLTASPGTWPAGTKVAYQWLRGGTAIPAAVASSYAVTPADAASDLSVVVTATLAGYADGSSTSAPVKVPKMVSTTHATLSAKKITRKDRATISITVAVPGVRGPIGPLMVKVGRKKLAKTVLKESQNGAISIKLPRLKKPKNKIKVFYVGTPQIAGSTSRAVKLVVKGKGKKGKGKKKR